MSASRSSKLLQKAQLRIVLRHILENLSPETRRLQSEKVVSHLLNDHDKFKNAKHLGIYLTKHNQLDITSLVQTILNNPIQFAHKRLYVPHIEMNAKNDKVPEICFYSLRNILSYHDPILNRDKIVVRESLEKADIHMLDMMLVPGLGFDQMESGGIGRIGRGKGYYDDLLRRLHAGCCYTIGLGYDEQWLCRQFMGKVEMPFDKAQDMPLDEFLCHSLIQRGDDKEKR